MPAKRFSEVNQSRELFAPRAYYFHPLLAGDRACWPHHLQRCREMQFDHLLTAPLFAPDADGNIFLASDHQRVHPAIDGSQDADVFIAGFAEICRQHGLRLLIDIVVGRVAPHADVARSAPGWFHIDEPTGLRVDPRSSLRQPDAAYARFDDPVIAKEVAGWWVERLLRLAERDVAGFRCLEPAGASERLAPCHRRGPAEISALPVYRVDAGANPHAQGLERDGIVEPHRVDHDRRIVRVRLTPAGRDLLAEKRVWILARLRAVYDGLTPPSAVRPRR